MKPKSQIILYPEGKAETYFLDQMIISLNAFDLDIHIEGDVSTFIPPEKIPVIAREFARARVLHPSKIKLNENPLPGEITYEEKRLKEKSLSFGILYDGFILSTIYEEFIKIRPRCFPIILTTRLFGTWDENDRRYHARTSIYSVVSIISTTGLIEAPSRPREYYILKQKFESMGKNIDEINREFKDQFLDYGNPRMGRVLAGYVLQAFFYRYTGDPFCENPNCCLYNAHWQHEIMKWLFGNQNMLCDNHSKILCSNFKNDNHPS